MTKTLIGSLFLSLCLLSQSLLALELKADAPKQYKVKKGDTLWDISQRFVGSPWEWPKIWHNNPQINDPDLIYPGDIIGLIKDGNKTKLGIIARGENAKKMQDEPIKTIPSKSLSKTAENYHFFSQDEIDSAAYILSAEDDRLLISTGDKAYAKGNLPEGQPLYFIYRMGKVYADKENDNEMLGREASKIGSARLIKQENELISLQIIGAENEIKKGDLIFATSPKVEKNMQPKSAPKDATGFIIGSPQEESRLGQYAIAAINLGSTHGVSKGSVFKVERAGMVVKDREGKNVQLPNKDAGLLMVYKVAEKMSYALVLKADMAIKVGDKVSSPQ